MNTSTKIITLLLFVIIASCKKPVEYYNKAVYAGNANLLQQMEGKIERLQEGYGDAPIDLKARTKMQVDYQEIQLIELKEFMGNTDSDPMINSAYALLEYDLNVAKAEKTQELFDIVDNATSIEQLMVDMEPLQDYYDEVYEKKETLYKVYDEALTTYADANDIEMTFYGRDIIPGVNDKRKKP